MRVGILTHYDVNNQGTQLQMYALYNKLIELGHEPKILTYNKNFDFELSEGLKNQVSIKSIPYYIRHYLLAKGLRLTVFNAKKYLINKRFRENNFKHEFYSTADIDCVVVGSDEVFSIPVGVNIMMYGHGLPTNKIFSYAPSFGQTDIKLLEEHNCKNLVRSGLSEFISLSARDKHTYEMVKRLTGKEPEIVCDPVILYDFSNTTVNVKLPKQKYILIYSYDRWMTDITEVEAIKSFAKSKNLLTVSAGTYHSWCDLNVSCNCLEWIEYFRGAEAVITDTFHGSVLSIITNKPMAVYIRELNTNKLTDLLERTRLTHRRVNKLSYDELIRVFRTDINFNLVNELIAEMRKNGLSYLKNALQLCKGIKCEGIKNE